MVLQISVKEDKAELFLQLIQELTNSMIEKFHIISPDEKTVQDNFFDEVELLNRINDIKHNSVQPLSRQEVFDGIC
jgi:hypothetical protein